MYNTFRVVFGYLISPSCSMMLKQLKFFSLSFILIIQSEQIVASHQRPIEQFPRVSICIPGNSWQRRTSRRHSAGFQEKSADNTVDCRGITLKELLNDRVYE